MTSAPPTEKGLRTRDRLLSSAASVLAERGCAAAGIAGICAEAGLAVGGFYRYFSSKEELISSMSAELREILSREMSLLPRSRDPLAEAEGVAKVFFAKVEENLDLFKVVREAEASDEKLARGFYGPLAEGLADRLAPFAGAEKAGVLSWSFLGILYFYAVKFLVWDGGRVPQAAAGAAARLCVSGISRGVFPWKELPAVAESGGKRAAGGAARMLSAAEEVFGRLGYNGAHVSEIAAKAGFAAGSFYLHFGSKKAALEKVVLGLRESLTGRAALYSAGAKSRLETEVMSFRALFDFIKEHPYGYRIMREAEFAEPSFVEAYYGYILSNYSARLRKQAAAGEFSLKDSRLLALGLMGTGHMIGMKKVLWKGFEGMTEKEVIRTVFRGIGG